MSLKDKLNVSALAERIDKNMYKLKHSRQFVDVQSLLCIAKLSHALKKIGYYQDPKRFSDKF